MAATVGNLSLICTGTKMQPLAYLYSSLASTATMVLLLLDVVEVLGALVDLRKSVKFHQRQEGGSEELSYIETEGIRHHV